MKDLVKKLAEIQNLVADAGVTLSFDGGELRVTTLGEKFDFEVARLNRPAVAQIKENFAPNRLLVLDNPSAQAVAEVRNVNHIVLPDGGFRIVAPGLVLMREAPVVKHEVRQVRLRGASGAIAETLLLGAETEWSVRELANQTRSSMALSHRVLKRLEKDAMVEGYGSGPNTMRRVINANALAQTWRDEESPPRIVARGYLYGSTPANVMARAVEICPQGAMGGVMAANSYEPTLTQIPYPLRFWVPFDFALATFEQNGLEITGEGANIEIAVARSDSWQLHRAFASNLPVVSPWRAWQELGEARGRIGELAGKLLHKLQKDELTWK